MDTLNNYNIKDIFGKTASVKVMYANTKLNKIEIMLPNDINWAMIGLENLVDFDKAVEKYQKALKDSCFNKMKPGVHVVNFKIDKCKVVLYLSGQEMAELHPNWENKIANDFEKNYIFYHQESVIINRKNGNKIESNNKEIMEEKIESSVNFQQQQIKRNEKKEKVVQKYSIYKSYSSDFNFDLIVTDILNKLEHLKLDDSVQVGKVINLIKVMVQGLTLLLGVDTNTNSNINNSGQICLYNTICTSCFGFSDDKNVQGYTNVQNRNGNRNCQFIFDDNG